MTIEQIEQAKAQLAELARQEAEANQKRAEAEASITQLQGAIGDAQLTGGAIGTLQKQLATARETLEAVLAFLAAIFRRKEVTEKSLAELQYQASEEELAACEAALGPALEAWMQALDKASEAADEVLEISARYHRLPTAHKRMLTPRRVSGDWRGVVRESEEPLAKLEQGFPAEAEAAGSSWRKRQERRIERGL